MSEKKLDEKSFYTILYCALFIVSLISPFFVSDLNTVKKVLMSVIVSVTFFGAKLFFDEFFKGKGAAFSFFASMLFMFSPYRVFVSFEKADIMISIALAIMPFYAWALLKTVKVKEKKIIFALLAGVFIAALSYTHFLIFTVMIAATITVIFVFRAWTVFASLFIGIAVSVPAIIHMGRYLLFGGFEEMNYSLQSIMPGAYRFGSFFNSFLNIEENPGFGIGMLICLSIAVWNVLSRKNIDKKVSAFYFPIMGILCMILASRKFPWEYVQRVGAPFLRYVGLWETPAFFAGLAYCFFTVPAGWAMGDISLIKDEKEGFGTDFWIRMFVIFICFALYIYQCSMMVY